MHLRGHATALSGPQVLQPRQSVRDLRHRPRGAPSRAVRRQGCGASAEPDESQARGDGVADAGGCGVGGRGASSYAGTMRQARKPYGIPMLRFTACLWSRFDEAAGEGHDRNRRESEMSMKNLAPADEPEIPPLGSKFFPVIP